MRCYGATCGIFLDGGSILTWQGWATDQQVWPLVGSGALHSAAVNHHDEFLNEGSPIASFLLSGFCFRAGPFFSKNLICFSIHQSHEWYQKIANRGNVRTLAWCLQQTPYLRDVIFALGAISVHVRSIRCLMIASWKLLQSSKSTLCGDFNFCNPKGYEIKN